MTRSNHWQEEGRKIERVGWESGELEKRAIGEEGKDGKGGEEEKEEGEKGGKSDSGGLGRLRWRRILSSIFLS